MWPFNRRKKEEKKVYSVKEIHEGIQRLSTLMKGQILIPAMGTLKINLGPSFRLELKDDFAIMIKRFRGNDINIKEVEINIFILTPKNSTGWGYRISILLTTNGGKEIQKHEEVVLKSLEEALESFQLVRHVIITGTEEEMKKY